MLHELHKKQKNSCCNFTPYVLMLALSVHSIFEGMAVGLASTVPEAFNMMLAIVIHKGAAGSSLGISLVKTFPDDFKLVRTLVFLFACATPLGVFLGMLISASEIYEIIFNSIAAGTFVYIACSEVIVEEFSVPGSRWWKFIFFLLGAGVITSLIFIE